MREGEYGYCKKCLRPLQVNKYRILGGKKICFDCINQQAESTNQVNQQARQNDKDKEQLYSLLLSLFNLGEIPLSWHESIDSMIKKNFTVKGVYDTLQYLLQEQIHFDIDTWAPRVHIFYKEAQQWMAQREQVRLNNEAKELQTIVKTVKIKPTTYRDMPTYKIEDL